MPASPVVSTSDLVTYEIKTNGSPIKSTYNILSMVVENGVNRIPYCEIEILDGSPDTEDFPISDSSDFIPGNTIEIAAGYENTNTPIFQGIIVRHGIKITKENGPVLAIICKDKAVKMTKARKNAYFTNTTDSSIIEGLIGNYGLGANVTTTASQLKEVVQYYATDWDFMIARADINGMITIVNNGSISIKPPQDITSEVLSLTYGIDIFEFEGEVNAENQFKSIVSTSWSISDQAISSQSETPANFGTGNLNTSSLADVLDIKSFDLQTSAFLENDVLQNWAKAKATKSTYSKVQATTRFQGNASAVPGVLLELKGLGTRFSGKGFVSAVRHELEEGNWITTAEIGLSPDWFTAQTKVEAPLASGLLPGIQGLQIGIVKQINEDPDGNFRVKIDLPLVGSNTDGVWARLGSFYASSGFGAFFFPETNDEVIVGFFNDDPRFPVILGSLYSSGRSPAFTPDSENNTKGLVTRSQMKVEFQEDKKIITITTPANNQLILSDDAQSIKLADQNSNTITMSSSGIEINSATAVTIKAATSMSLEAGTGATVKVSEGDLSMQAMNISSEGELSFKAQGNVSSELTSSGEVKIQGTMVMIN